MFLIIFLSERTLLFDALSPLDNDSTFLHRSASNLSSNETVQLINSFE